jgi:SHS family lactate transporter-like MFS transporter
MSANTSVAPARATGRWYSEVTRDQWRAFSAVFLGWIVDAFDFNIMTFILLDIQKSFSVNSMLAGMLGSVTLMMRLIGGTLAGAMADRWGRKLPLMLSVLWFSLFACLSGFSTSYAMLFALRLLFGIGMGGEWAAGMPLVFEHWPKRLRGHVSGLMLGGWYWGYLLAALTHSYVYPLFSGQPDLGWRVMFWIAIVPALFTLWIRARVPESPAWLERQRLLREGRIPEAAEPRASIKRIFQRDMIRTTLHTTAVISAFMGIYYSVSYWYPTFLEEALGKGVSKLPFMIPFNIGAIVGTATWGRISEGRLGRRGAFTITIIVGMASLPLYLHEGAYWQMALGALLMGSFGMGIWGMAPAYTNERFPTSVRGVGPGFCYHAGAFFGAIMPTALGALKDMGMKVPSAMMLAMLTFGIAAAILIWLGPETRGRDFTADS